MLPTLLCAVGILRAPLSARRVGADAAAAKAQKRAYFEMAPWEDMDNQPGG